MTSINPSTRRRLEKMAKRLHVPAHILVQDLLNDSLVVLEDQSPLADVVPLTVKVCRHLLLIQRLKGGPSHRRNKTLRDSSKK